MGDFDRVCEDAVRGEVVNCLGLLAKRKDGSVIISKYLGPESPEPDNTIDDQTVFTLASCTKLATTVAALHAVEKNLVKLDDEIDHILPELAGQKILVGFEQDGSPILKPRQRTITLRQLLTHSAGLGYTFMNEELAQYQKSRGKRVIQGSTVEERFGQPLLYEPGTAWNYSASLDWTGKLVERVAKKSLEDYLVENVWKPLGATGFTFWPDRERKGKGQLATLAERQLATGKLKPLSKFSLNEGVEDCLGGQGGYSNAESFMKLLHSLLANDEKVLQKQTVDMMFQGQLSPESKAVLNENMKDPAWAVGDFYPGEEYDWGFGGLLVTKAAASGPRQSGTLAWSGAANLFWFIDRSAELCGLFITQVLPAADPIVEGLIKTYQEAIYDLAKKKNRMVHL